MSSTANPHIGSDALESVTPVTSRSAAAQVADQIAFAIREERLTVGDRLPPERELARRFGVSRPTMREALTALELAPLATPSSKEPLRTHSCICRANRCGLNCKHAPGPPIA